MPCPVCAAPLAPFASGTVLGDVEVTYQRCTACGLVRAADADWLERAYSAPIARLDVGLLDRGIILSNVVGAVLRAERLRRGTFLDWAGGYGTLTRLMRDRGYDFHHCEPMAQNVFAAGFEAEPRDARYDMVTAVEVLEHLSDPVETLQQVADSTDLLLATTVPLPEPAPRPGEWYYYAPESGQHITFYTPRALEELAGRLGFDSVVTGPLVHLFHRRPVSALTRRIVRSPKLGYLLGGLTSVPDRRHSLMAADVEATRQATGG